MVTQNEQAVIRWLQIVAALIFIMVLLGGATRLTESGLSMVDWHPVTGWFPPLSDVAWQAEFDKYKQTPEFIKENSFFEVDDFKQIFWLEFLHRLLGRLIGIAFALPFFWFLARRQIPRGMTAKLWVALALGGAQGFMGWYMVKSGLVDRPSVSQYRLAAHLGLAVIVYGYLLWLIRDIRSRSRGQLSFWPIALMGLIFLQLMSGAFVAGLDAGVIYNTWPLIDGALIPSDIYSDPPFYPGVFEDYRIVQFNHRMLAYLVAVVVGFVWFRYRHTEPVVHGLVFMTLIQIGLGIWTLLMVVPIWVALAHQAGALALFTMALALAHKAR
ncbi:MAG: heme A synthase [Alphaproteobacteria bacterium]|nr:MAG: heme A synthase [Alphaproteobacteria bacterium]